MFGGRLGICTTWSNGTMAQDYGKILVNGNASKNILLTQYENIDWALVSHLRTKTAVWIP
jgi:hypothetical protein